MQGGAKGDSSTEQDSTSGPGTTSQELDPLSGPSDVVGATNEPEPHSRQDGKENVVPKFQNDVDELAQVFKDTDILGKKVEGDEEVMLFFGD